MTASASPAEIVHLKVGQPLLRFAAVRPGAHRYLRYTVAADGARSAVDIWERRVSFETAADGKRAMHIVQR